MLETPGRIWVVVDRGVGFQSGYARRVLTQLELTDAMWPRPILVHPDKVDLPQAFLDLAQPVEVPWSSPWLARIGRTRYALMDAARSWGQPILVYAHNLPAAHIAISIAQRLQAPLVLDYHGAAPDEARFLRPGMRGLARSALLRYVERHLVRTATIVVTVSHRHAAYLGDAVNSIVLPMLPPPTFLQHELSPQMESMRTKLGIPERATVFCYLGNAQPWQLSVETLRVYQTIETRLDRATYLLIISPERERFTQLCRSAGVKHWSVRHVEHADIPSYLQVCDYGFALRAPSTTNIVASPTKVLEYLSQGVRPVITEYVGDFSSRLKAEGLAVILPYEATASPRVRLSEAVLSDLESQRTPKERYAARVFVKHFRDGYVRPYLSLLETVSQQHQLTRLL